MSQKIESPVGKDNPAGFFIAYSKDSPSIIDF